MFNLSFTNNYFLLIVGTGMTDVPPPPNAGYRIYPVQPNGGKDVANGVGNFKMNVPGMGDIVFLDLGTNKLPQYTNPKIPWTQLPNAGLIRYRGLDAYFCYQGTAQVNVTVDRVGSINLTFPQGGMLVSLDDVTVG